MSHNTRIIQRFVEEGKPWERVKMKDLKEGDVFRAFEPNGIRVENDQHGYTWTAKSDAYENEDGVWTIVTESIAPKEE